MAKRSDVIKPRGYPDSRGIGARSDFAVQKSVPSEEYKFQQMAMVQELISAGVRTEDLERMFHVRFDLLSWEKKKDPEGGGSSPL